MSINKPQSMHIQNLNLHIHTRFSDGAFHPKQIIERSIQHSLDIISITDHDTIEAYNHLGDFEDTIRILPGIEFSSTWKGTDVHILGYGIDIKNYQLLDTLKWMHTGRKKRAEAILAKLYKIGIKIPFENVMNYAGDINLIVRPHIAQALVSAKYCRTKQEAFEKFIGNEAPAYVPKPDLSSTEVINLIHKAGGVAIVAHPSKLKAQEFIDELITVKLDGIEVWHPDHSQSKVIEYQEYCLKKGLIMTGGSDFHGEIDIDNYIGSVPVSDSVVSHVKQLWNDYKCQTK